jgi:glycosidase
MLALVVALLSGCSGDDGEALLGRWTTEFESGVEAVMEYRTDDSWTLFLSAGGQPMAEVDRGTYSVAGDTLTFETDIKCRDSGGERATYTWSVQGDEIVMRVSGEDPCEDRRQLADGVVWTRQAAPTIQPSAPPAQGAAVTGAVPWWNEQVFYEVFVRSFSDSDGDGIGDLRGLIDRLDHLNDGNPATGDDLGVTALWLMPVTQSPSYHGYDTTDYRTIEVDYGTNADFATLVDQAHARGMQVIVDLMLNHTSSEHPWFTQAAQGPEAARRDWYVWSDDDPGQTTAWGSPAWHPLGEDYYLGLFWEGMPDLNYRTPEVTDQMYQVARFWLEDMGADGLRLDAVRHLIETDGQFQGTPETHQWLAAWDDFLDSVDPEALTVGEVWDSTEVVEQYVDDDEVDIAFEFALAESMLASVNAQDPSAFAGALATALAAYPPGQFAPFLTNHDQNRVMTQLGGDLPGAKLAASMLLTLPGVPFVYYGEEIGMTGAKPDELIRTPMQWTSGPGAGFTNGTAWQAPNADAATVNVAAQDADPGSLLSHYRTLIHLRTEHPALQTGDLRTVSGSCPGTYGYLRSTPAAAAGGTPDDAVLVILNFTATAQDGCAVDLPASGLPAGTFTATDLITGQPAAQLTIGAAGGITGYVPLGSLAPRQAAILELAPAGG